MIPARLIKYAPVKAIEKYLAKHRTQTATPGHTPRPSNELLKSVSAEIKERFVNNIIGRITATQDLSINASITGLPSEPIGGICYRCQKNGHRAYQCPEKHSAPPLTSNQKREYRRTGKCYTCHEKGHRQANCPNTKPPQEPAEYGRPAPTRTNNPDTRHRDLLQKLVRDTKGTIKTEEDKQRLLKELLDLDYTGEQLRMCAQALDVKDMYIFKNNRLQLSRTGS
jgi:hypothetical protein